MVFTVVLPRHRNQTKQSATEFSATVPLRKRKLTGPRCYRLRLPDPRHHVALEDIGDLTVELVEPTVQDKEGLPGRGHEVLSEQPAALHRPVPTAPRPIGRLGGFFQALDHLDLAGAQLHEQGVGLAAGAAEHVVLVDLGEGALEGQVGQVQVGVDVERRPDLPPLRDHLDPHQAVAVVDGDQVATVRGHVGSADDVVVLADDGVRHAVQDELRLGGAGGVGPAVDEVVSAEMGVGYRLGDAVVLPQADVFHVRRRLQVDLVENRLISVKDESESVDEDKDLINKKIRIHFKNPQIVTDGSVGPEL